MTVRLERLRVRNIRSYESAELAFGPGTTLLAGDIGAGKSSLLFAIEMALFGFAEVEPAYLVRHGAREAEVTLSLASAEHRWEVRRRFARRTRKGRDVFEPVESSLDRDGARTRYSPTELRRETVALLGFPDSPNPRARSDVWRWAVYIAQERMRDVLDSDAEGRLSTVRKALGVEQYRLAADNAHEVAGRFRDRAADLDESVARGTPLEAELVQWTEREGAARARRVELQREETEAVARARVLREEFDRRDAQRQAAALAREALGHLEQRLVDLDRLVARARATVTDRQERLAALAREIAEAREHRADRGALDADLRRGRERKELLARRLEELAAQEARTEAARQELARWTEEEREAARDLDVASAARGVADRERSARLAEEPRTEPLASSSGTAEELRAALAAREADRRGAERRLVEATAAARELAELVTDGVCPRCHRPIAPGEFEPHRAEAEEQVRTLSAQLADSESALVRAQERLAARTEEDRSRTRWDQLEERRAEARRAVERAGQIEARATERHARGLAERDAVGRKLAALLPSLALRTQLATELDATNAALASAERARQEAEARAVHLDDLERQAVERERERDRSSAEEAEAGLQLAQARSEVEAARAKAATAPDAPEEWTRARSARDAADRTEAQLRERRAEAARSEAEASAHREEVRRRLEEREANRRAGVRWRRLAEWLDGEFRSAMQETESRRLARARQAFERYFARYFTALVDDPALSPRVDERFAPSVDVGGEETPAEGLSGGERTALALAYRLALGRVVRDADRLALDTLILDEPTEGFSHEQNLRMADLLESLGLPQVILVSHERQLEGVADRIYRVEKAGGTSRLAAAGDEAPPEGPTEVDGARAAPGTPSTGPRRRRARTVPLDAPGPVVP